MKYIAEACSLMFAPLGELNVKIMTFHTGILNTPHLLLVSKQIVPPTIARNSLSQCLGILLKSDRPVIDKTQKIFNEWLQRDLSLGARVLLTKAEGLSKLIYVAPSVPLDPKLCKSVDQLLFHFLWKRSIHYIIKSVIMNTYDKGVFIFGISVF